MKAGDLRLGNLILSNGVAVSVIRLDEDGGITSSANEEGSLIGTFKPILITGEWLLKLGFQDKSKDASDIYCKQMTNGLRFIIAKLKKDSDFNLFEVHQMEDDDTVSFISIEPIETINHLQNFWHSFTGNELTIKK